MILTGKAPIVMMEAEITCATIDREVMLPRPNESFTTKLPVMETFDEVVQRVSQVLAQNLHFRIGDTIFLAPKVEVLDA